MQGQRLTKQELVQDIACRISQEVPQGNKPFFVGLDGPDCAGKTTVAKNLVAELKDKFCTVLVHFDDYANQEFIRKSVKQFSVDAFLWNYFDENAICRSLDALSRLPSGLDVIIVEGLFLFRPRLAGRFDYRVRLEVDVDTILARALARDVGQIGDAEWVRRHYVEQCIPAQCRYVAEHLPAGRAQLVATSHADGSFELGL